MANLEHYETHYTPQEAMRHLVEDVGFQPDQITLLAISGGSHIWRTLAKIALHEDKESPHNLKDAYIQEYGL